MSTLAEGKAHFNRFLNYRGSKPTCNSLIIPSYFLRGNTQKAIFFSDFIGHAINLIFYNLFLFIKPVFYYRSLKKTLMRAGQTFKKFIMTELFSYFIKSYLFYLFMVHMIMQKTCLWSTRLVKGTINIKFVLVTFSYFDYSS